MSSSKPSLTYEQALAEGRKVGARRASDPALMALFCADTLQYVVGAVAPQLVWEGAQAQGLRSKDLVRLCATDPLAVSDLMWAESGSS
ncbi:hypothetical protein ADK76_28990 [Streptomyces griseoflavus]|uniref:hypothetical protein n=1 Tax=Streptomyces rimosus TaxID=1927 RepID=UPI0004C7509F|nr:hypothetical protein [Streptomyces rimosus]KOG53151.1 hypothetical protein ADK76_28990 [Streptomyces griseoflavus]